MPNGDVHRKVGAVSGGIYAGYRARNEEPAVVALRVLGGALGGHVGGAMPDILEPASWPGHRQICHSVAAGMFVLEVPNQAIGEAERVMIDAAARCRAIKEDTSQPPIYRCLGALGEVLSHVVAGVPSGAQAGYLSHLALDGAAGNLPITGSVKKYRLTRDLHELKQLAGKV